MDKEDLWWLGCLCCQVLDILIGLCQAESLHLFRWCANVLSTYRNRWLPFLGLSYLNLQYLLILQYALIDLQTNHFEQERCNKRLNFYTSQSNVFWTKQILIIIKLSNIVILLHGISFPQHLYQALLEVSQISNGELSELLQIFPFLSHHWPLPIEIRNTTKKSH